MNREKLDRLIEKYYKGESTEEEELTLREIFQGNNAPVGYETERRIFSFYNSAKDIPEPSQDFETRILEKIDEAETRSKTSKSRKYILAYLSVAAGILILTGSYFFFVNRNETVNTFSDPELAYAETIKVLMYVSSKLNEGTRALEPVGKINEMTSKTFDEINNSAQIIKKNLKNLNYLQNSNDTSDNTD